ncbi:MAG: crossover junction endodeoxyribonuclease RuvC [Candidatus Omnitrophica bacterium]|nr:crossover junction endodeoxyribonuclease RuvC [Candidatus Omnitrophota bacterium]
MRIVGVDPGTRATGYGFIEARGSRLTLLEAGTIVPKAVDGLPQRIHKIYSILDSLIGQYQPEILVLEKLYSHHRHPATVAVIGHVRGVICLLTAARGLRLVEHSAKRIRKAVTGNGNATKAQTRRMIAHVFGIDEKVLTLDASDALALGLGYIYMNGR